MNWFKRRSIKRQAHWLNVGQADYRMGVGPNNGPFNYDTNAYIWWVAGWTIAWNLDKEKNDED